MKRVRMRSFLERAVASMGNRNRGGMKGGERGRGGEELS